MNQIFKTALSGEFNRAMRGIGTFYKTALSEIRVEWNRVKRGVPVQMIKVFSEEVEDTCDISDDKFLLELLDFND